MSIEELQTICSGLKGVTEDIRWEDHLCFNIGSKMFLVTTPDKLPQSVSFKVTERDFGELTARDGFIPAPYMARYKWVYTDDINRLSKKEWEFYATQSYQLVAAGLPTKTKKQIGLQ